MPVTLTYTPVSPIPTGRLCSESLVCSESLTCSPDGIVFAAA